MCIIYPPIDDYEENHVRTEVTHETFFTSDMNSDISIKWFSWKMASYFDTLINPDQSDTKYIINVWKNSSCEYLKMDSAFMINNVSQYMGYFPNRVRYNCNAQYTLS